MFKYKRERCLQLTLKRYVCRERQMEGQRQRDRKIKKTESNEAIMVKF